MEAITKSNVESYIHLAEYLKVSFKFAQSCASCAIFMTILAHFPVSFNQ